MFSNQSAEVSLDAPCRALSAVWADKKESRFLGGSSSVVEDDDNFLYMMRFHAEVNELGIDAVLAHATGPVQKICCSPTDASIVITAAEQCASAQVYKLPAHCMDENDNDDDDHHHHHHHGGGMNASSTSTSAQMELICSLEPPSSSSGSTTSKNSIVDICWRDSSDYSDDFSSGGDSIINGDVLTLDESGRLTQWHIAAGGAVAESTRETDTDSNKRSNGSHTTVITKPRAKWDPHGNGHTVAVTQGASVHILDWRTQGGPNTVERFRAHGSSAVTDLDYNPNKPYTMTTAGQDGLLKFWDLRMVAKSGQSRQPLLTARGGHSHWVWNVQYNPFHDQLVLSTGTDAVVNLWRMSSISSAPLLTLDDDIVDDIDNDDNHNAVLRSTGNDYNATNTTSSKKKDFHKNKQDERVSRYEHGDGVYGATWASASDAWIYMTLGYDGKAVLNHVPSQEKYKILL